MVSKVFVCFVWVMGSGGKESFYQHSSLNTRDNTEMKVADLA